MVKQHPTITSSTPTEIWKPIPGFEELYCVSNQGRVRREEQASGPHRHTHLLQPHDDRYGYPTVRIYKNNRGYARKIHAIVAAAFIGARPEGMGVNHIDGNKLNNTPENLEYLLPGDNSRHGADKGLLSAGDRHYSRNQPERLPRGSAHGRAKLTERDVQEIRRAYDQPAYGRPTQTELARKYNVRVSLISMIVRRKIWTHI